MNLPTANETNLRRSPRTYPPVWTLLVIPLLFILTGCVLPVGPEQLPAGATASPMPVIAVAPPNGQPGTVVSVASAGWQPHDVVYINLEVVQAGKAISTTIGVATADNDGRVTTSFVLPPDAAKSDSSEIQVVAYSSTTGETTAAPFTLGAGTITGTVTTTVTQTVTPTVTPPTPLSTPPSTPSPTLVPTVGATVTPTPLAGFTNVAHILLQGLNLRAGPGVGYAIIDNLDKGIEVLVLGQSVNAYWLNISLPSGSEGWVARPYTDFKQIVQTIPVAQPTYAPGRRPHRFRSIPAHPRQLRIGVANILIIAL